MEEAAAGEMPSSGAIWLRGGAPARRVGPGEGGGGLCATERVRLKSPRIASRGSRKRRMILSKASFGSYDFHRKFKVTEMHSFCRKLAN